MPIGNLLCLLLDFESVMTSYLEAFLGSQLLLELHAAYLVVQVLLELGHLLIL